MIDPRNGMEVGTFVAIPMKGQVKHEGGEKDELEFTLCLHPDAARALVNGIAGVVGGGEPPKFQLPGAN